MPRRASFRIAGKGCGSVSDFYGDGQGCGGLRCRMPKEGRSRQERRQAKNQKVRQANKNDDSNPFGCGDQPPDYDPAETFGGGWNGSDEDRLF